MPDIQRIQHELESIRADLAALNRRVTALALDILPLIFDNEDLFAEGEDIDALLVDDDKPVLVPVPSLSLESAAPEELVFNDEWKAAIDVILNGNEHVFVTGGAGVGKSTLLQHIVEKYNDAFAVLAPTGVAALRVGGQTIHSFFKFGAHALHEDDIQRLSDDRRMKYKALKLLIIDEGSMIRADVMDGIDVFLRKNGRDETKAFGGVRLVIFGDLFQLPPVSKDSDEKKWLVSRYGVDTPYFFHAAVWRTNPLKIIQLSTIFRQKDPQFTDALNAIRAGAVTDEHLALLNSRVQPHFMPPANELWITLTTTNAAADAVNRRMIDSLKTEGRVFKADIFGDFNLKDAPTDELLELKVGATVMFIRNHPRGWWMNGTLGRVTSVNPLKVTLDGANSGFFVDEAEWESIVYEYDAKTKKLARHVKGSFTQVPLKVAAAITGHKSQGVTLDRVIVDLSSGAFSAGQTYVMLSRCRTLAGTVLRSVIRKRDIIVSDEVRKFLAGEPITQPKATDTAVSIGAKNGTV